MNKFILLLIFNFIFLNSFSQTDVNVKNLEKAKENISINQEEIQYLKIQLQKLKDENKTLTDKLEVMQKTTDTNIRSIDSLRLHYQIQSEELTARLKSIDEKINNSELSTEKRFTGVDESISKNTLYWLIAVLATTLLSAFAYLFLRKKQNADRNDLVSQLTETKSSIEENLVKEFTKQTELMEDQLKITKNNFEDKTSEQSKDHSFALKVADEITMFERNLSFMDSKTRGMKQLNASINRLKDNLEGNGYEIPELLGKKYLTGMKLTVINFIPDDTLNSGDEIVSKIIKPQVNFNGIMIQSAQIDVSVG